MKFKKKNVKVFVLVTTVLLFILTFVSAIYIFADINQEARNEPFKYPKEDTMTPKPLPSENTMITQPLVK